MNQITDLYKKNIIKNKPVTLKKYFFFKIIKAYLVSVAITFILLSSSVILRIVFKFSQFPIYLIFFIFLLIIYQLFVYTLSIGFLSSIIYSINNMQLSRELQSLYNIGYDNKILKSIFFKISIFLSILMLFSFHFFIPFTNKFASVTLLKNISYMFEPKLIWKNSIELPNLILSYEKFDNNKLIGVKIVDWNHGEVTMISSSIGYFTRNMKSLTLKLKNAKIKILKDNNVIISTKKEYLYRMDLTTLITKFIKNIKENNSIHLIRKLTANTYEKEHLKKTSYELGKRTALSITPFNFYSLGFVLAFLIPTTSLILSQFIALVIVFTSFYSVMVISSKLATDSILLNFLLPFVPNIMLFLISSVLLFVYLRIKC